jgi:hypothetical protein
MPLSEATKTILNSTLKEWMKFAVERERLTLAANELAVITRKVVQECLAYLKTQTIDVQCDSPDAMKLMNVAVQIEPVIEANFPNVKASVTLKCGGSARAILINPNMTFSAGGNIMSFDQLKKGIPEPFFANAADFVRDSFLYVARNSGKEE